MDFLACVQARGDEHVHGSREFTMNHCNNTLNHCKSPMWWPKCRHVYSCDMVPVYPGEVESSTTIVTNYKTYMSLSPHVACWITCILPRLYNVCQEELQKKRVDITISISQYNCDDYIEILLDMGVTMMM